MRNLFLSLSLLLMLFSESRTDPVRAAGPVSISSHEVLPENKPDSSPSKLTVDLRSPTDQTVLFKREDGEKRKPEVSEDDIPHLILKRNGVLTPDFERTLLISVENVPVLPSGTYVQLTLETQHTDPDLGRKTNHRIRVWKASSYVPYDARNQRPADVHFRIRFAATTNLVDQTIQTPTDYFRYRIVILDSKGNRLQSYTQDYAFLLENQWRVPLPDVLEQTLGAAPSRLLIYYYDMVPFQSDMRDPDTQIPRQDVDRFIQTELLPRMVEAFQIQTNLWKLPWYPEWSSSRPEEDPKTLSVALGGDRTWFHGSAPSIGHALISIRVDGTLGEYSDLTDGILSVFHHELFHNQQRNISLHFGKDGTISGQDRVWEAFSEGTAVLAASVAQPDIQFEAMAHARSYVKRANAFIGSEGAVGGGLNQPYKAVPYHTALYWRFLYEQCGGMTPNGEDPARGMKLIRNTLETLYRGEIVDINSSTDVAGAFPRIMDRALQATPSCPFHTYEDSLIHFARAIYLLKLEGGRCSDGVQRSDCGLIDPYQLYETPPADQLVMADSASAQINGSIPSSYGIDLIDVELSPAVQHKTLKISFVSLANAGLAYHVEVWKTRTTNTAGGIVYQAEPWDAPISAETRNGILYLEIPKLSKDNFDGLGLIITRMDPLEEQEKAGVYSIQLNAE